MPELSASSWKGRLSSGRTRTGADEFLELHEGVFLRQAPDESNIFHGEIKQCVCMVGEARDESMYKFTKSMKDWTSFLVDGVGQLMTLVILTGSILTLLSDMIIPKYLILVCSNSHFSSCR
jgi:hypothetical protein